MKKIITLLFSTAILATSFSQGNHSQRNGNDDYAYHQNNNYDRKKLFHAKAISN